jgi:hypothetical protein
MINSKTKISTPLNITNKNNKLTQLKILMYFHQPLKEFINKINIYLLLNTNKIRIYNPITNNKISNPLNNTIIPNKLIILSNLLAELNKLKMMKDMNSVLKEIM